MTRPKGLFEKIVALYSVGEMPSALPADSHSQAQRSKLTSALDVLERHRPAIKGRLRALLEGREGPPYSLMRYHLGWEDATGQPVASRGGKLLRPGLCLLCCEAAGGEAHAALRSVGYREK